MFRTGFYRVCLTLINIVFPPLLTLILTGAGMDTLINCILFLLAVIPSHVHGFYISWVYFSRRHKVKRGRYPGKPHSFIYSEKINNGGLTSAEVDELWFAEKGLEKRRSPGSMRDTGRGRTEKRPTRTSSRSSSAQQAPPLPPPSPARPHSSQVSRSSSKRSDIQSWNDEVRRHGSQRDSYGTRAKPVRSSSHGSVDNGGSRRRRDQIQAAGYGVEGSAPTRRRPMATVRG